MSKKLMILIVLLFNLALFAQAAVNIPITVSDTTGVSTILSFGLTPTATDGIDASLGEAPLPPLPPTGVFDARFLIPSTTDASLNDYRQGTASNFTGTKVHTLQYQVGLGTKITLSWNLPAGVTGRLQDFITGTLIDVSMATGAGSYVVTNPGAFSKLQMTITYNLGNIVTIPAAPTLLTPENNSIGTATSTNLAWRKSIGADKYTVQLSTNSSFTYFLVNDTNIVDTIKAISGLTNGTVYYWRVNARNSAGTSTFSSVNNFTTLTASSAVVNIPITISDLAGGSKTMFFGLDPAATDGLDIGLGEAPLPPLPPTGVFDARFLMPNTTDASLSDYRYGTTTFNGSKVHQIQFQLGTGTNITLSWNLPAGVTGLLQDVVTGNLINVQMNGAGSYVVTNPSSFNKLQMTITYNLGGTVTVPPVPVLATPANNATGQPTSLNLTWNASSGATSYRVQLATDTAFSNLIINDSTVTSTSKAVGPLANNTVYYWRVNAKNSTGVSAFTSAFSFTTIAGVTGVSVNIPITVTDTTGVSKTLFFGLDPNATDGIDASLGEAPLPPLPPAGVFDARFLIPAITDASLKDFRHGSTTFNGTKVHQMQFQVGTGTKITLSWNLPAGVTGILQDVVTGTLINVTMATGAGSYVVTNPGIFNKLNMTIKYSFDVPIIASPTLLSPVNNSVSMDTVQTLYWKSAGEANVTGYRVQLAKTADFASPEIDDTMSVTYKRVAGLSRGTDYYWRALSRHSDGLSTAFSIPWKFTTAASTAITMKLKNVSSVNLGDSLVIPIVVSNFNNIGSFTLKIVFDTTKLKFVTALNWNSSFVLGSAGVNNGVLVIAWDDLTAGNLPSGKLVDLKFKYLGSTSLPVAVSFNTALCEVTDNNGTPIQLAYTNASIGNGSDINGQLLYHALLSATPPPQSVLNNVPLQLFNNNSVLVDTTSTNGSGEFHFLNCTDNVYQVKVNSPIQWGGVTSNDALQLRRYLVGQIVIDSMLQRAGDVNHSGSLTSADALLIRRRLVGLVSAFSIPDWVYSDTVIIVNGSSVTNTITAVCAGDVNSSYVPTLLAKSADIVTLSPDGRKINWDNKLVEFPIRTNAQYPIGAVTLIINYDVSIGNVTKVETVFPGADISINNGLVKIAWDDINGLNINSNEPIVKLQISVKQDKIFSPDMIALAQGCEFADKNANVQKTELLYPSVVNKIPLEFGIAQNYPNPFNPSTAIKYSLPKESNVKIEIFNGLGQKVADVVNTVQAEGEYQAVWKADAYPSGLYMYSITASAKDGSKTFREVRKMLLLK